MALNVTSLTKRTPAEWAERIADMEAHLPEAEHRVTDIEAGCRRLQLMASEGSKQAAKDLERQTSDLQKAVAKRDSIRSSLAAARELAAEAEARDSEVQESQRRERISELADERHKLADKARKHIDGLTAVFADMWRAGAEIDRLAKSNEMRAVYTGEGFSGRVALALGPALVPFQMSVAEKAHPRFGEALPTREPTGEEALALLDRDRRMEQRMEERRQTTKEAIYGSPAA